MDVIVCSVTALEYWRCVGRARVLFPKSTNSCSLPLLSGLARFEPLCLAGVLSYPLHVLTSSKQKSSQDLIQHCRHLKLPRGSIYSINAVAGITSPELTLLQLASSLSVVQLAGLMTEFSGLYSLDDSAAHGILQRAPLTTLAKLVAYGQRAHSMKGLANYRAALRFAMDNSRSPMETAVALLLTLPVRLGGYGIPKPKLNAPLALREQDRAHIGVEQLRPDMLWEDSRVCLEYDSASFHGDETRHASDAKRKNAFVNAGFRVVTLTKTQLASIAEMNALAASISKAVGHRLRLPDYQTHLKLRKELLGARSILRRQYQLSELLGQDMMYLDDGFGDANAECGLVEE